MSMMQIQRRRITKWQVVKYMVAPQIVPRIRDLIASGLHYVPFFIALVYQAVRLLPPGHPYLDSRNVGKFGIRHVIGAAAANLKFTRKNIDQIIVFGVILVGLVLAVLQILILGISLLLPTVMAQATMPTNFNGFFVTPDPSQDLAHMMLDMTFGVEGVFNSCVSTGAPCYDTNGHQLVDPNDPSSGWMLQSLGYPYPIHRGLHAAFQLYSLGLLVIASMITAYFIATVVAETAQTGTAFGKRFNKVWAPIRIVVAFGLLIPIGGAVGGGSSANGLNSAQYIVLYAAKFGSAFATNGWRIFYSSFSAGRPFLRPEELISEPNPPEINALLQAVYVASICYELEEIKDKREIGMYLVKDPQSVPNHLPVSTDTTYDEMIKFVGGKHQAIIRFGIHSEQDYPNEMGYVAPICGEIIIPLTDSRDPKAAKAEDKPERGFEVMQRYYFYIVKELWHEVFFGDPPPSTVLAPWTENYAENTAMYWTQWQQQQGVWRALPPPDWRSALLQFYRKDLEAAMKNPASTGLNAADPGIGTKGALQEQRESLRWNIGDPLKEKGWAAAGIWFNRIAEMNGALTSAVLALPMVIHYPKVMEYVAHKKEQQDENVNAATRFEPKLADSQDIAFPNKEADSQKAKALWAGFQYWQSDGFATTTHTDPTGNFIVDSINYMLGTSGLFNMRKNAEVHPLAQLVGIGRSLIEASIRNFGAATVSSAVGFMIPAMSGITSMAINLLMTISTITLTTGFILFYIVPFLPFIYFFFAVCGWVKGIFEAMVGAPLWALAHIRIDGEGLPGKAAMNGYFLIFEIFLRPILIIFGLLASLQIFSAMVQVLNQTWDLVTANLTGFDATDSAAMSSLAEYFRSPIDEFFFTVIYAIVVYLAGMSSFKLIDQIPNNILRWMGAGVSSFGKSQEDAAGGLIGATGVGMQQVTGATTNAIKGGLQGINKMTS